MAEAAKPKAVVVGAGAAGALAALYLAQRGVDVEVFERAPQEKVGRGSMGPRSYNMLLGRRALEAMEGAGLQPTDFCARLEKIMRYRTGAKKFGGFPMSDYTLTVDRGELIGCLLDACQAHSSANSSKPGSGSIAIHFGQALTDVDFSAQTAHFTPASLSNKSQPQQAQAQPQPQPVHYDLLIGADGAGSRVRQLMASSPQAQAWPEGPLAFTQKRDSMEYKPLLLPDMDTLTLPVDHKSNWLTFADPKLNHTITGGPGSDGAFHAVYIMPEGDHGKHTNEEDYVKSITSSFPVFTEAQARAMASQLVAAPVSFGGYNTRCSRLHGPACMLLGDAAHSMWPSMGQGGAAALEDCTVLAKLLASSVTKEGLAALPSAFTAARLQDAVAAVDITESGFGGTKSRSGASSKVYMLRMISQLMLSKALPFLVPKPAIMTMNESLTPYSVIKAKMASEEATFKALVAAGLVGLAVVGAKAALGL